MRSVPLCVIAADEDHPRHVLLQEQIDILRFRNPTSRLSAQDRCEPLLGQRTPNHLGEGREDRVLQFWEHEAHQPGPLATELARSLVPQDVECRQHCLFGALGNPGSVVEYPRHRCLAHTDLAGYVGKSSCHFAIL